MEKELTHDEMHEQDISHDHGHSHTHTHKETKAVLNRMSKIIGHMEAVKMMVENGRDCSEVLIQLAAVKSAISSVSRVILKDHIDHCIIDAVRENDTESIEELKRAIDKFL
ncbi:MAG: metal-sensing transcriptional repressor [Lachnospiraceae bacterium]|nr:metal-sensing transcriptional repressor [Lachnospiraceae bacterium]